jgi:hypothetical protein
MNNLFWWTGAVVWSVPPLFVGLALVAFVYRGVQSAVFVVRVKRVSGFKPGWKGPFVMWARWLLPIEPLDVIRFHSGKAAYWPGQNGRAERRRDEEDLAEAMRDEAA